MYRSRVAPQGIGEATDALRRWLAHPGSQPSALLEMACYFPQTEPALRTALEILL
ncbi:MAG: hypothetical protein ACT4NY_01785 [Pseudonocardiales bacterium]